MCDRSPAASHTSSFPRQHNPPLSCAHGMILTHGTIAERCRHLMGWSAALPTEWLVPARNSPPISEIRPYAIAPTGGSPAPCACRPHALPCPIPGSGETAPRPPVKPRSTADMQACARPLRWWCPLLPSVHPALLPLGASRCPDHHRERAGGLGLMRQRGHEVRGRLRDENRRRRRVSPLSVRPEGRRSRLWGAASPPRPPRHVPPGISVVRPPPSVPPCPHPGALAASLA
jgi:hypothetical protein